MRCLEVRELIKINEYFMMSKYEKKYYLFLLFHLVILVMILFSGRVIIIIYTRSKSWNYNEIYYKVLIQVIKCEGS